MTADGRSRLVRLRDTDLTLAHRADDVRDRRVVDESGDEIGSVDDLVIDLDEHRVRFLLVGSRGFLGLAEKREVIPADAYEASLRVYHGFPPLWGPGLVPPRLARRHRR